MPAQQDIYNAKFVLGWNITDKAISSFDVIVRSFDYSWALATSGQSFSRQRKVVYPKRVERTSINVSLIFRNVDEYLAFGRFMRDCHLQLTSVNNAPDLFFVSSEIRRSNAFNDDDGNGQYGVKYSVVVEKVPMRVNISTVAPTMNLTLGIVRDMFEIALDGETGIQFAEVGSAELHNAGENLVSSSNIASSANLAKADAIYR